MRLWVFAALMLVGVQAQSTEPEHGFAPAQATAYITDMQQQLTTRGYYGGVVDGRMTPALRTAISVYQSDVGMRVTGIPDLAVLNMLKYGPDVRATIQPLGQKPPALAAQARTAGVPPYEAPEPYRYPEPTLETPVEAPVCETSQRAMKPHRGTVKAEEPPLPKAAPQHRVVLTPLPAG